jgi:GxxExxY protein
MHQDVEAETDVLAKQVVDAAIKVHKTLGPGLLESVYEACLVYELTRRGVPVARQVVLPIFYDDMKLDSGLRLDMVVGERVIVELKSVEALLPIHDAQLITYLKLSNLRLGLLINFNTCLLRDGIKRIVF